MSEKSKILKISLRFEKKILKTAQVRCLSKIVYIFANVAIKTQVKVFQLPLEMNSTVTSSSKNILSQPQAQKTRIATFQNEKMFSVLF